MSRAEVPVVAPPVVQGGRPGGRWSPGRPVGAAPARDRFAGRSASAWSRLPTWLRRTIVLVILVAFWQVYVSLKHVSHLVFASPASAVSDLQK